MKRKELEAMGLEKEQVDQIMTQNGADIEAAKKELQDQVTTLTTEKEELQGQLNTANETLKGFKDVDVNDLRGQIDKLTNDLDQAKKDADARVADLTFRKTRMRISRRRSKPARRNMISCLSPVNPLKTQSGVPAAIRHQAKTKPLRLP